MDTPPIPLASGPQAIQDWIKQYAVPTTTEVVPNTPAVAAHKVVVPDMDGVVLATAASAAGALTLGGITVTNNSAVTTVDMIDHGPIDPTVFNIGAGAACAVGCDANGNPVRVTDPTCVTGLKYVGTCDATGALYVAPRTAQNFDVTDFGAVGDATGTTGVGTDDTAAIAAADAAAAVEGGEVFFPNGMYRTTAKLSQSHGTTWRGASRKSATILGDHADFVVEHAGVLNGSTVCDGLIMSLRITSTVRAIGTVTGATNATPIVVSVASHGLATGDFIDLGSIGGNTAANGPWQVTFIDSGSFSLNGSVGNGGYTSGGTAAQVAKAGVHESACSYDEHYRITVDNCFFGVIWEQAEVCNASSCILQANLIMQMYIPNGDDITPGASPYFNNALTFLNMQLDGGQYGLGCDGGAFIEFLGGNINGNSIASLRLADMQSSKFEVLDIESTAAHLINTTLLKGTAVGGCSRLTLEKTTLGGTGTNAIVITSAGDIDLLDCTFKSTGTKINGGYNAASLNIKRPIYTGTLLDNPPNYGAVQADGGPEGALRMGGTAAPTSETYNYGAIVWNTAPTSGGFMGWVCTVAGSPGTWKGFGLIA